MMETSYPWKDDRRRNHRVTVDLWLEERSDGAMYFQHATNLSTGGLFLDRTLPHAPGTRLALELRLPGEDAPLRVAGEVVDGLPRDAGMSVRFVGMTLHDRARIADFLARVPFCLS